MTTTVSAQEPIPDARIEALVKSIDILKNEIEQLRRENANLRALIRGNQDEAEGVPEIDVMKNTPGQHVMHPQVGVPVYTKSQWITYSRGQSKVIELIRNGNKIVPVASIIYGDMSAPAPAPAQPAESE